MEDILKRLKDSSLLEKIKAEGDVSGYQSPGGRITYNVAGSKSFAAFSDIIDNIVPFKIITDPTKYNDLPSIAKVLVSSDKVTIYPKYLIINSTDDKYTNLQDEEDQKNMNILFKFVDDNSCVAGIAIQKNKKTYSAHGIAFIAIKKKQGYRFAYYDPMAFRKGKKSYSFTDRAFVNQRFEQKIDFVNLNKYCYHTDDLNFHCSQYVINAEYCYIYSVFFLWLWMKNGTRFHRASLRKAIKESYIVSPAKLTRANTDESITYRVVMMIFVCNIFVKFLQSLTPEEKKIIKKSAANIKRIQLYTKEFHQKYGFWQKI